MASLETIIRELPTVRYNISETLPNQIKEIMRNYIPKLVTSMSSSKREKNHIITYIDVKLADEAGEIVMFEVFRKQITSKLCRLPEDEARSVVIPRDDVVDGGIIDKFIRSNDKWTWISK